MTTAAASPSSTNPLPLGIAGVRYADLYEPAGLRALYQRWHDELAARDAALCARYDAYRASQGEGLTPEEISALLVDVAPSVSEFVIRLFGCKDAFSAQRRAVEAELVLFRFKDEFVKRRAWKKKVADADAARAEGERRLRALGLDGAALDDERQVAPVINRLLDREAELKKRPVDDPELIAIREELGALEAWAAARKPELEQRWLSFQLAQPLPDALHLVELRRPSEKMPEEVVGPPEHRRARDGFKLTDRRMSPSEILAEVDYCLYCHDRAKDSCSTGLHDPKTGAVKPNALGVELNGCPLDERISEMHLLKRRGDSVGALALVCIDNPMLPGTGHRICNDCMKSCIYQKQDPVNIPQIETAVLTDVLSAPWGFEIYGLLTRWNPLNARRPYALPYAGTDVMVVGLGPAGYTLAHYLVNEGFGVVGIDGLKIEPLPAELVGDGGQPPRPIRDWSEIYKPLDARVLEGFGGV
ncbi:MAG TPA: pyridine nucleotide-disulfide oxidoreductase, partial [Polyangia bacterium]|nr:pyridine nucleotide-disulfide oxidoreductase [Polyangia bacterium]